MLLALATDSKILRKTLRIGDIGPQGDVASNSNGYPCSFASRAAAGLVTSAHHSVEHLPVTLTRVEPFSSNRGLPPIRREAA